MVEIEVLAPKCCCHCPVAIVRFVGRIFREYPVSEHFRNYISARLTLSKDL